MRKQRILTPQNARNLKTYAKVSGHTLRSTVNMAFAEWWDTLGEEHALYAEQIARKTNVLEFKGGRRAD